jgi:hypothetical protein
MSALYSLIELNLRSIKVEEISGTGEERIKLNALMLEQERILKEEIGEVGFDEVIDAIVEFIDGNMTEEDVRKVYAKWA